MIKKVLSFILVFSMFFTNLTFVNAFNMPDEKTDVPDGTFESKLEARELSNFVSKSNGEVTSNEDGVMLSIIYSIRISCNPNITNSIIIIFFNTI